MRQSEPDDQPAAARELPHCQALFPGSEDGVRPLSASPAFHELSSQTLQPS